MRDFLSKHLEHLRVAQVLMSDSNSMCVGEKRTLLIPSHMGYGTHHRLAYDENQPFSKPPITT
jgi:hypothetical protein